MKRVVITGGTGFIGSWLVKEMLNNGTEVIALVRDKDRAEKILGSEPKLIEYYSDEYNSLHDQQCEIDAFYHLAWEGVSTEKKNDRIMQVNNINRSLEMFEYASTIKAKRFIATGTVAEYSYCEDVMDVNAKQTPSDLYSAAKTSTHYMLEIMAKNMKMPFNWVVIPSTFGEGRKDNNIITYTIKTLLAGDVPNYGYLTQMWDFLYVSEVARALYLIGHKGKTQKTYAIGSGKHEPLHYYIKTIRDMIDPQLELGIGKIPSLSDKVFSSCVSINELTEDTGFIPCVSFEEGMKKTIEYFKNID